MGNKDESASGAVDETAESDVNETETDDSGAGGDERSKGKSNPNKKILGELKSERQKRRELEERLNQLESDKLKAEGNKDELIKSLQTKLEKSEKRTKELYGSMAQKTLNAQIKAEATKAGCIDPDAVMALADLSDLEVDAETFEADAEAVTEMITGLKKSKPYLFSKPGPKINTKLPGGGGKGEKEDYSKMSKDQIREKLREMDKIAKNSQ
jgi:hypothetical protein